MARFRVLLERGDDGWWVASVPALPGCVSQGRTREHALANIREAIALFIEATGEPSAHTPEAPVGAEQVTVEV